MIFVPGTHLTPWHISLLRHSLSLLQISWQTLSMHNSCDKQASSVLQRGLQNLAWHWNPLGHWFSDTQVVGSLAHPITAVGLGKNPTKHEHWALWSTTVHWALGPQDSCPQGSEHLLPTHDWEVGQSEAVLQPTEQTPPKQTCPRKQSLSSLQVNLHCPWEHLSLLAQSSSDLQASMQMPSGQIMLLGQAWSERQVFGIRTHSTSAFPVKPSGHVHCFLCFTCSVAPATSMCFPPSFHAAVFLFELHV